MKKKLESLVYGRLARSLPESDDEKFSLAACCYAVAMHLFLMGFHLAVKVLPLFFFCLGGFMVDLYFFSPGSKTPLSVLRPLAFRLGYSTHHSFHNLYRFGQSDNSVPAHNNYYASDNTICESSNSRCCGLRIVGRNGCPNPYRSPHRTDLRHWKRRKYHT